MNGDHPRSRGVYPQGVPVRIPLPGSSPLARGLQYRLHRSEHHRGIIPARAGFTVTAWSRKDGSRDHPRSRGVYLRCLIPCHFVPGSSPLARGLPHQGQCHAPHRRIIPARAGFTVVCGLVCACVWDHPRSRGVYERRRPKVPRTLGSSPLARGLHAIGGRYAATARIIPARAGFTRLTEYQPNPATDHPRSRGVYGTAFKPEIKLTGSSPLARGLLGRRVIGQVCSRIIPARAGFTAAMRSAMVLMWDHPRSRGVYQHRRLTAVLSPGSSPLARGLPHSVAVVEDRPGIIPARAGFTSAPWTMTFGPRDHPRSRGVYSQGLDHRG